MDRRRFISAGATLAGVAATHGASEPAHAAPGDGGPRALPAGQPNVVTPNGATLPWKTVRGVKVGHLVAEAFEHEFAPGLKAECWGYNGLTPGPTIEAVEGDRVRIYVTNRLPEPTTVHWHGIILPNGMDGVAGLTQKPIPPGQTFKYEFTFRHAGTFMYHPHYDEMTQMALGMEGMIVVHPKAARGPAVDRDFVLMTHEWKIRPGMRRPDPNAMLDFNVLTLNAKCFPGTAPLVVGKGERVRIRFGNLSAMDHHPIHLHGFAFKVTATDGGYVPESAQRPETTVLVPTGATRVVEFVADALGDWAMHCHMTHHIMNQMGHDTAVMVGADGKRLNKSLRRSGTKLMPMGTGGMGGMAEMKMPVPTNSIPMHGGQGPFSYIDMGGMFTILKVREHPEQEDGSGWYKHPDGSVADVASEDDLRADGIDTKG